MKNLLFAAALMLSTPALAFNVGAAVEILDNQRSACSEGYDHDGGPVTKAESKAACLAVDEALSELKANGYCYAEATNEWTACK